VSKRLYGGHSLKVLAPTSFLPPSSPLSYDMQVCESHRGQKLGGILMNMLQAIATKSHMRKIMLTVFLANQGARRFYERLGYKSDLISPVLDNDGEDDTPADYDIMSIALN
jgi:GNAT superfamily N-acetyltransferase